MRIPSLSLRAVVTALGVLMVAGLVSIPLTSGASAGDNPSAEREAVRAKAAQVASQVNALEATDAEVTAALDALEANVRGQKALLEEAQRAAEEAEAAFAQATAAVKAKQAEIAGLRQEIREFAVQAFVHPPADDAMAALDTADPGEAAQKRALLEVQNSNDADLLDRLSSAEEDLEVERQVVEAASRRAEEKRAEAAGRLSELQVARDQQAAFLSQVEAKLAHAQSEAAHLAELDASLSKKIAAEQAELARRAAAAGGRRSGGGGSVSYNGDLATVSCPTGGTITVDSSIAGQVQALLNLPRAAELGMCGWGWRSSERQEQLWYEHNCDVQCTTPTARPGTSMHERGLAIDFTSQGRTISSYSSPAYEFMDSNRGVHKLSANVAGEPWHWSTNGN